MMYDLQFTIYGTDNESFQIYEITNLYVFVFLNICMV